MRRKQDDKRVLRSGNGRQSNSRKKKISGRKLRSRGQRRNSAPRNPIHSSNVKNPRNRRNKKKRSNKVVFLMILALVAFVIGAGIGVSLSFDNGADEGPHYENVTKEMTSDLNSTEDIYFDKTTDDIDYNENESSQLNVHYQYSDE